jgi:Peptidase inhibitor I9
MNSRRTRFVLCNVLALSLLAMSVPESTIGQSIIGDRIFYPPEFSPLVTSRPRQPQPTLVPSTKFVKAQNAIPNSYIVVLNDDVVTKDASLQVRHAQVTTIANRHALAYLGKVGYIYESALYGYSIELPGEAAAISLSQDPAVKWVEENAQLSWSQIGTNSFQSRPPWGLDANDGSIPTPTPDADGLTNGIYIYNSTGSGARLLKCRGHSPEHQQNQKNQMIPVIGDDQLPKSRISLCLSFRRNLDVSTVFSAAL